MHRHPWILVLVIILAPATALSAPLSLSAQDATFATQARSLAIGQRIEVTLPVRATPEEAASQVASLTRFRVFANDARILADDGGELLPPDNVYLRGQIEGRPDSLVVLTLPPTGPWRGILVAGKAVWTLSGDDGTAEALALDLDQAIAARPFTCGTDALPTIRQPRAKASASLSGDTADTHYVATLAIETDYELYALFGSEAATLEYLADVFAFASAIYQLEIGVSLEIGWTRLWTQGPGQDPWSASSTSGALDQLVTHWRTSLGDVERTVVHMLSGKSLGGGIAYVGVLCNKSYGYGVSASISGGFDPQLPTRVWDILVTTHEIGHNFGSPHTHDYCGIGGVAAPVDTCYASLCSAGGSLPCAVGSGPGDGCGTIMSYCHLLGGGYGNITLTFGLDHPHGVSPERVPEHMRAHVLQAAQANPTCLPAQAAGPVLTVERLGSGSGTVSSAPAGIDCGSDCSHAYGTGTDVSLTASADPGSAFTGFGGDCVGTVCSLQMDEDKAVTATFTALAGISVAPSAGLTTSEQGGTAQFQVVLTALPTAQVDIALSSTDPSEGVVSPATLSFTTANWSVPKLVSVTGVDDSDLDGDIAYAILTAPAISADPRYQGIDAADVGVVNIDDEGTTSCPATALADAGAHGGLDLGLLYALRDEVLARSAEGQWMRAAYYRHGPELTRLLLSDRALRLDALRLFDTLQPALRKAVAAGNLALSSDEREAIAKIAEGLMARASAGLAADLRTFLGKR